MTEREVLTKAKAEISKGWIQGKLTSDEGVCLYGALVRASGLSPIHCATRSNIKGRAASGPKTISYSWTPDTPMSKTVHLLADHLGIPYEEMALWNDAPGRTALDIINLIDRVLESLPADEPAPTPVAAG